jgi:hypothetical protein
MDDGLSFEKIVVIIIMIIVILVLMVFLGIALVGPMFSE